MGLFRTTVDLNFPYGSGGGTNTWHIRTVSEDGNATELNTLMGHVKDFYTAVAGILPTGLNVTWDGYCQQIAVPDPVAIQGTPWGPIAGQDNAGVAAAQDMVVVTWRTTLSSRRGRGRTFLGPIGYGSFDGDGTILTGDLVTVRSAANALVAASTAALDDGAIVVWSELDQVGRDIVGYLVNDKVAHLSSRRG